MTPLAVLIAGCTLTLSGFHVAPVCNCGWEADEEVIRALEVQRERAIRLDPEHAGHIEPVAPPVRLVRRQSA